MRRDMRMAEYLSCEIDQIFYYGTGLKAAVVLFLILLDLHTEKLTAV